MPEMSGIQLIQKIREHSTLKDRPLLMITAEIKQEKNQIAIESGVNRFLIKPYKKDQVEERIKEIFG